MSILRGFNRGDIPPEILLDLKRMHGVDISKELLKEVRRKERLKRLKIITDE